MDEVEAPRGKVGRLGYVGALNLWLLPTFAVSGGMALAPWLFLTGLASARLAPLRRVGPFLLAAAPLLLLMGWLLLSATLAPASAYRGEPSYLAALKLTLLTLGGLLFIGGAAQAGPEDRRFIRAAATIGILVLALALMVEAFGDMPLNRSVLPNAETGALMRNPGKGVSILVALVWGAIAACAGGHHWQRLTWRALFGLTLVLSLQFDMNTNVVGFGVGAVAFILTQMAPRIIPIIGGAGLALWTLIAPFVAPLLNTAQIVDSVPLSWAMRVKIWDYAHDRIMEKPIFGWGLGGARHFTEVLDARGAPVTSIPLHPHSMSLHVWLEAGAVGAVLVAATILACGIAIARTLGTQPLAAAAAAAALGTIGVIWNVSYGAWQEWWFAVPFMAGALAAAARR